MDRKTQLIDHAIQILAEEGVARLTIRRLARSVGITDGAIYRHFESKDAIIRAILERFNELSHYPEASVEDPVEGIRYFLLARYQRFQQMPQLAQLLFLDNVFQGSPELLPAYRAMMHRHMSQLEGEIERGQREGRLSSALSPQSLFRIIVGPFRLLVTQWVISGQAFDLVTEGLALWEDCLELISNQRKHHVST